MLTLLRVLELRACEDLRRQVAGVLFREALVVNKVVNIVVNTSDGRRPCQRKPCARRECVQVGVARLLQVVLQEVLQVVLQVGVAGVLQVGVAAA